MLKNIIGRQQQIQLLQDAVDSNHAELIAVYGRRRVGKTYLIKEFFDNKIDFYATGIYKGKQKDELQAFIDVLQQKSKAPLPPISSWMDAFRALRDYLDSIRKKKLIVFLDELPWFDVPPGQFIKAFEWFWNSWGSTKSNLKMIVCGSATTWMTDKFIASKGGLYNRTTVRIPLSPFNLNETRQLLHFNGIDWPENIVLEAYMIFGGVPYYLSMLKSRLSLDANIDNLFFSQDAVLRNEYEFLFRSLFRNSDYYMRIIDALSSKNKGMTRKEIIELSKVADNGTLSKALKNLISCDFIRKYDSFEKKERDSLYQLTDLSILFIKRFVENYNGKDYSHWSNMVDSPKRRSWSGIAFEEVCLLHLPQIKRALGISGIQTDAGCWSFTGNDTHAGCQIDMIIVRADKVINLCEMKYSSQPYAVTAKYARELLERAATFREVTKTKFAIHQTLVSPWGLKKNSYSNSINQTVDLNDLFQ